ncbi:cell wall-binding repeat-containing protein [Desulfitobacterium hafniense]|uniref:cell wall-binding repeat-containing protein n=1 Tax=Desulfitobacterium hafniense TaxID=49338 RepID=UPI00036A95BB|nr:cell wall-binding repeat-containing protein [Desulfitobacterium hafniense]
MVNLRSIINRISIMLISIGLFILTFSPMVSASTATTRLAGDDRYLTAIAVSQEGWTKGSETIVLTTGQNYPDALSASPLAGKYSAPILLVGAKGLDSETLAEIKRLSPKKAYIVGGTGVIPSSVESQLSSNGISAVRLAGQDRYETAMTVARSVGMSKGIFIVPGQSFTDTLSVAPIAAAEGMPIIPVPSDDLTKNQKTYFQKAKLSRVIIVGSQKEIPNTIRNIFSSPENINGADPYIRNIALLEHFGERIDTDRMFLATGDKYPDALAAAAYAKLNTNPIVLLSGNQIPPVVQNFFAKNYVDKITVLGGEAIISSATVSRLNGQIPTIEKIEDIDVNVVENQSYELPGKVSAETGNGNKVQVPVNWNLTNVSTDKAGTYYFTGTVNGYAGTVQLTLTVEAAPAKIDSFNAEIIQGKHYTLPETVTVTLSDYSTKEMPVRWSTAPTVSILNKVGTYTFQGTIEGTVLTTTLNLKVSEDKAITFKDGSFEWAVKYMLGKQSSSQPLYLSEALEIFSLDLKGYGIKDLTGLEVFTNLESLNLENNFLKGAELAKAQNLTNLKYLNLKNNEFEQISSLRSLTKLEFLDISMNEIKDFSPIRDLTRLTSLYLKGNLIEDYSPARLYYHQLKDKDFTL